MALQVLASSSEVPSPSESPPLVGLQPASTLPAVARANAASPWSPGESAWPPVDVPGAQAVPALIPATTAARKSRSSAASPSASSLSAANDLAALLVLDPTLASELHPESKPAKSPSAALVMQQLRGETEQRLADVFGGGAAKELAELREALVEGGAPGPAEVLRVSLGFLRSELAPALRRLSRPGVEAALSADRELAKAAAGLREGGGAEGGLALRARLEALADACSVAAANTRDPAVASAVVVYALWALSRTGSLLHLPERAAEAATTAAAVLIARLAARLEFNRADRYEAEENVAKAAKDAARAEARALLDRLTDEERELRRELRRAIRGADVIPSGEADAEADMDGPEPVRRSDDETLVDAAGMYS